MIVLFLLFPRIQGSLFGLSLGGSAKADFPTIWRPAAWQGWLKMTKWAFRAMFYDDPIPSSALLYWRGIVFQNFDGRGWHVENQTREIHFVPKGGNPVSYTVTLEPHNSRWLFAPGNAGQNSPHGKTPGRLYTPRPPPGEPEIAV